MTQTDSALVLKLTGKKIKTQRKSLKLTQQDFAEKLSVTRTSVTNIEAGKQNLGVSLLVRIADALNCDISDLVPKIR